MRAMERASKRIALLVAADKLENNIDWPHMYIKRVVDGKGVGVHVRPIGTKQSAAGCRGVLNSCKPQKQHACNGESVQEDSTV